MSSQGLTIIVSVESGAPDVPSYPISRVIEHWATPSPGSQIQRPGPPFGV